ncbi:DNA polymerase III subunit chi [bacterium M00.F.Ca.ET.228.01.1.1]|uniref:DNA polymerase III subunit chi n=1 Tax=Burkholderiaceae TaxID=119060 RepID=UPI0003FB8D05|nr:MULTISPECIES: DNA polymerase III subunit chi [Burkholderiaceae]MBW9130308.1 DNA polymerase III subunit chi [Paraburkholderia ginsengiterrae]TGP43194.1 DNA polymerase III subunit chi [bacterium M00.F.Ca.ET.228.01.1.1]TGS00633.1 DNA polymerase III subunit chi [bacterium M00.F.Ca.ET.191.01.1.1]TGU05019.1 DNA polymerase III subunit chi [bacterium M00.F.Ca.ET.155.01.1.1]MBW0446870.1 DNA polymerase III subunit chi [Paraburkholderia phenoliruptrix]
MTRIDFHSNVGDSLLYACRLARKAYQAGQPTIVVAEPERLRAFDEQLWTFSALDFVPHCMAGTPLAAQTPIVLATNLDDVPHHQVLLNLGASVPAQFARFERLLEVVGNAHDELIAGRERYRFYRDRGYALNNYKQGA